MTSRDATARASKCPTVRCSGSAPCPAGLVACHGERPGRRRDALVLRARNRIGRRRTHGMAVLTRYATASGPCGSKPLACSAPPRPFASCGRGRRRPDTARLCAAARAQAHPYGPARDRGTRGDGAGRRGHTRAHGVSWDPGHWSLSTRYRMVIGRVLAVSPATSRRVSGQSRAVARVYTARDGPG